MTLTENTSISHMDPRTYMEFNSSLSKAGVSKVQALAMIAHQIFHLLNNPGNVTHSPHRTCDKFPLGCTALRT